MTRIESIVELVNENTEELWDLCCDHGKIGQLGLTKKQKIEYIYFVDIVKHIISSLSKDADIPDSIKTSFLTKSAAEIDPTSKLQKTFVMAGIGGSLCITILKNLLSKISDSDEIIISANSQILELREFLITQKIKLVSEKLVLERGQFYELIVIARVGRSISPYGDSLWSNMESVHFQYLDQLIKYYSLKSKYKPDYSNVLAFYNHILNT